MRVGLSDGVVISIDEVDIAYKITSSFVKNPLVSSIDRSAEIVLRYMTPGFGLGSIYKHTLSGSHDINVEVFDFIKKTLRDENCVINKMNVYIGGYTIDFHADKKAVVDILLYEDGHFITKKLYRF